MKYLSWIIVDVMLTLIGFWAYLIMWIGMIIVVLALTLGPPALFIFGVIKFFGG